MLTFLEDQLFKANFEVREETLNRAKYSRIQTNASGVLVERIVHLECEGKFAEVSDWSAEGTFISGDLHYLRSRPEIHTAIGIITA